METVLSTVWVLVISLKTMFLVSWLLCSCVLVTPFIRLMAYVIWLIFYFSPESFPENSRGYVSFFLSWNLSFISIKHLTWPAELTSCLLIRFLHPFLWEHHRTSEQGSGTGWTRVPKPRLSLLPLIGLLSTFSPWTSHFSITCSLVLSYLLFSVKIFVFMGFFGHCWWWISFLFFFLILLLSNAQICSRIRLSLGFKNKTIKENQMITVFIQLKSVQKTCCS